MSGGWYLTQYLVEGCHGGVYGASLWAANACEAAALARRRGLGEELLDARPLRRRPHPPASALLGRRKGFEPWAAAHGLCFLGHLAIASGVQDSEDIVGDAGLLHNFIHLMAFGPPSRDPGGALGAWPTRRELVRSTMRLETRVPGYLSAAEERQWSRRVFPLRGARSKGA